MVEMIGVTVSGNVADEIIELCDRHGYAIKDPYFTLIPGENLKGVKGMNRKLQSFCLSQPPVKTIIGGPYIESSNALKLAMVTGAELTALRDRLIKHLKLPPASVIYRRLHIPLIVQKEGSPDDFAEILADAKRIFSKPRTIIVSSVSIYKQKDGDDKYNLGKIYSLSGK